MTDAEDTVDATALSPEEAFEVLGNEIRLQVMHTLGESDEPLAFSEIFDRISYDDYSNFGYHLEKLVGTFVRKTDDGYELRQRGSYVLQSILSGAVTDEPVVERTALERQCLYCGSQAEMSYREGTALLYCSECDGQMGRSRAAAKQWAVGEPPDDIIGYVSLPPAGVRRRSPTEIFETAETWAVANIQPLARGICPQCSAPVELSARVCDDHDSGVCDQCRSRYAVHVAASCVNCTFDATPPFLTLALGNCELMAFMLEHDIDPMAPSAFHKARSEETVLSRDPLLVEYTFLADEQSLSLTVDEELSVVDATRSDTTESG